MGDVRRLEEMPCARARQPLDAMVIEAGLSYMYGDIHYRFDIEAGQQLGRSVAYFTIAADRSAHSVLSRHGHEEGDGRT